MLWTSLNLKNHRKPIGFSLILRNSQYPAPDCLWHHLHFKFVPYSFPQRAKVSPKRPMVHPRAIQRLPRSLLQPPRHVQELLKSLEELHKSHHGIPRWSCTLYWSPKSSSRGPHDSAVSFSAGLFSVQSRQYSQVWTLSILQSCNPPAIQFATNFICFGRPRTSKVVGKL